MKRLLLILVVLAMLLSACQTPPAEVLPEPEVDYPAQAQAPLPTSQPVPGPDCIPEYACEPMTWTDRINLVYEWLSIYDEEHRMAYDFTYDVRKPFEEFTDEERWALSGFSMILLTTFYGDVYGESWEEAMLARGHIRAGYDRFYSPVILNAPDPGIVSNGPGAEYWVFPNLYAAFLFAGGYEAGFETLWENRLAFLREMGQTPLLEEISGS